MQPCRLGSTECVFEHGAEVHLTVLVDGHGQGQHGRHQRAEQDGDGSAIVHGVDDNVRTGARRWFWMNGQSGCQPVDGTTRDLLAREGGEPLCRSAPDSDLDKPEGESKRRFVSGYEAGLRHVRDRRPKSKRESDQKTVEGSHQHSSSRPILSPAGRISGPPAAVTARSAAALRGVASPAGGALRDPGRAAAA